MKKNSSAGEEITLRYVPLDECRIWDRNPKSHDLDKLRESFRRYGYVDPAKMDAALASLVYGNGRHEALGLMRDAGEDPPRGILDDPDKGWLVPVQFGIDQESRQMAESLAIGHNSLTAAGLPREQVALLFDAELMAELMTDDLVVNLDLSSVPSEGEEPEIELKPVELKAPKKVWVLIGIDAQEWGTIAEAVEKIAEREGVFCEVAGK